MKAATDLKAAVNAAIANGATRYSIAKGAGIGQSTFIRWLDEDRDIRFSTAAKLMEYLNLELRPSSKPRPAVNWDPAKDKKPKGKR